MLDTILAATEESLAERQARRSTADLLATVTPSDRDFLAALSGPSPAFILEVKPRSPSAGFLRSTSELATVLAAYRARANVVSVLTEERFFGGSRPLLASVRRQVPQPILCKDFIVDPYQVVEARVAGADAVLLMLSVLNDDRYRRCAEMADRLAMGVLTEAHTADEIGRARALRARAIGINNRRLGDLTVDLVTTEALAAQAPVEAILIAESGIGRHQDVVRLRPHVDGFLVGTSLMKAADPDRTARGLIFGPTKICGLTRAEDAIAAATAGATHGGIVFAPRSRRRVAPALAAALSSDRTLDWVGVFLDQPVEELAELAAALGLAAVQLHGSEDQRYCAELRHRLPAGVEVWKAVRVRDRLPEIPGSRLADRVLFDSHVDGAEGGTGRRFDWSLLDGLEQPDRCLLGGGLGPDNAAEAQATGIRFLDVSTGVERAPGVKDPDRLAAFFAARRAPRRSLSCA